MRDIHERQMTMEGAGLRPWPNLELSALLVGVGKLLLHFVVACRVGRASVRHQQLNIPCSGPNDVAGKEKRVEKE